jgi:DNA-binding response OmpR family regulator
MQKRILVLDDNKDVLDAVQEVLTYSDFKVKTVEHITNIFDLINEFHPDLLLLDYLLWETTGAEICHQIKTNLATANLPVIIISAYPCINEPLVTRNCDAVLSKPFNLIELLGTVNKFVN